jgi:hypothetical protein
MTILLGLILNFLSVFAQNPAHLSLAESLADYSDTQYLGQNNIIQNLTWGESYVMEGYINMYEITGNTKYLNYFVKHANAVIAQRDDKVGAFLKRPVWSTKNNVENNEFLGTVVCSGMITFPIARFIQLVRSNKLTKFNTIANYYLRSIQQTINWHIQREYRESILHNQTYGFFSALPETSRAFIDSRGRPMYDWHSLPFNMQNALGRSIILLYEITRNSNYLRVASGLFKYYQYFWTSIPQAPAIVVPYWSRDLNELEDVSHGAISNEFVRLMHEYHGGIGRNFVVQHSLIALLNLIKLRPLGVAFKVDGSMINYNDIDTIGLWGSTNNYTPGISKFAANVIQFRESHLGPSVVMFDSLAMALRGDGDRNYGEACSRDAQCKSGICYGGQICGDPLGNSSSCTRGKECASGICFKNQVCASALGNNSICYAHHECASKLCSNNRCSPTIKEPVNRFCISDDQCSSGLCSLNKCVAKNAKTYNSSCFRDEECQSNICFGNKVCGQKLGNGSTCYRNSECVSGICFDNKICAAPLGPGSTCYQNNECASNVCIRPSGASGRVASVCQ